jgi:hypothetical protein
MNIHETISILKLLPKQGKGTEPVDPGQQAVNKAEKSFKDNLENLNKSLGINNRELDKKIQLLNALESATLKTADRFNILEERALGVQKSLKLNTDEAIAFARSLDGLEIQMGVNRTTAKQYIGELQNFLPGTAKLIEGNTKYFKTQVQLNEVLRDRLKLDENSANAFRTLTNLQNGELIPSLKEYGQIATDFAKGEGGFRYQGGFQDFFEEISKLSDDIVAQFSRMGKKELVKTVLEAKRLGLTLNDLQKSGEGFLDVQKQTEASVKFQMFAGKKFETQTNKNIAASMAKATIEGDAAKQLEIINDVIATHGDQLKTNFMLRKAAADAMGVEESVLAKVLKKQKELARIADNKGEATELSTEDLAMLDKIGLQTTTERVKRGTAQDQANLVAASEATFVAGDIVKAANTFKDTLIDFFEGPGGVGKLAVDTLFISSDIKFASELLKGSVAEVTSGAAAGGNPQKRFGGPVAAGTSYVVGEVGPEIFTPSSAGTITPNNQMASNGGGSKAIVDALKGMQFNVINKFDGDAILTSIQLAEGNRLT